MLDVLKEVLVMILYTVVTGCGVLVVNKLLGFLNTKIDEAQAKTKLAKAEKVNAFIDNAQIAITTAVDTVTQTYVDGLKKSGKFDYQASLTAKDKATELAKKMISDGAREAITLAFGDFDEYLSATIESAVKEQ